MLIPTDILINQDNSLDLITDNDCVPYIEPYRVKVVLPFEDKSLDFIPISNDELLIKHERSFFKLNFDVNDDGELVVIGEDSQCYYISDGTDGNDIGDLIYNSDLISGGIGQMIIEDDFIVG
jgi:hypothetical protein